MTYAEWQQLESPKSITVPAREIGDHQVEITLPTGKAVIPAIRRHSDQPAVVSAEVTGQRAHFYGANEPYDAGEFAGGFQVSHLTYADGTHSNYLGNCYGAEWID